MLSYSISGISCYLKALCFRPKPLQKHQLPEREIKKRVPKKLQFCMLQTLPKPSQNAPQTPPKPSKMDPKSNPGGSKSPFGEHSRYKHQKMKPKAAQGTPQSLQTPPKTLPKPAPNPLKIDRKTQAKKPSILKAFCS